MESGNVKLLLGHEEMRSKHRVAEIVLARHSKKLPTVYGEKRTGSRQTDPEEVETNGE